MRRREITVGSRVYDRADPRHVGVVLQVNRGGRFDRAKVRWEETRWLSCGLPLSDLRLAPEDVGGTNVVADFKRAIGAK